MKMKASLAILGIFLLVIGFAVAAEEGAGRPRPETQARPAERRPTAPLPLTEEQPEGAQAPARPGMRRGPISPDQPGEAYNRVVAQRSQEHVERIKELEEIKKIAQEENATKTVAAIDALIAKKQAEYQKAQAEEAQRRDEFRQRIQERMENRGQAPARTRTPRPETQRQPARPAPDREQPQQAQPETQQ